MMYFVSEIPHYHLVAGILLCKWLDIKSELVRYYYHPFHVWHFTRWYLTGHTKYLIRFTFIRSGKLIQGHTFKCASPILSSLGLTTFFVTNETSFLASFGSILTIARSRSQPILQFDTWNTRDMRTDLNKPMLMLGALVDWTTFPTFVVFKCACDQISISLTTSRTSKPAYLHVPMSSTAAPWPLLKTGSAAVNLPATATLLTWIPWLPPPNCEGGAQANILINYLGILSVLLWIDGGSYRLW